ncbi:MAG TPA: phosphopantothenoylcysteine decarboxylase, partial [Vicinamibacterales bacterium]|nr:phosphopantothenoylcysteine decarboxylase [Vicinamibacterales bacterium]
EDVRGFRREVEKFLAGATSPVSFRALRVPMGIYEQRESDTYMVRVRGAVEMRDAVMARAEGTDAIIMAAAVADYAPAVREPRKVGKSADAVTLELRRTPDILAGLGAWRRERGAARPVLIGFAAETGEAVARGRRKLEAKHADFIVVNDVLEPGAGFEVETNVVTLVGRDWEEALPLQAKSSIARAILDRLERALGGQVTP